MIFNDIEMARHVCRLSCGLLLISVVLAALFSGFSGDLFNNLYFVQMFISILILVVIIISWLDIAFSKDVSLEQTSVKEIPTHNEFQKAIDKSKLRGYEFANCTNSAEVNKE